MGWSKTLVSGHGNKPTISVIAFSDNPDTEAFGIRVRVKENQRERLTVDWMRVDIVIVVKLDSGAQLLTESVLYLPSNYIVKVLITCKCLQ